jgi:mono/diheme cytochrome c family protein
VRIPLIVKIGALIAITTALYTYIGQLVPQKEVAPPEVVELSASMTTADLVRIGRGIAEGKGLCLTCHTIGKSGSALRFPDLGGIATRAAERVPGLDALSYMAQSIYHPDDYIVPGFNPGMPAIHKPPIGLTDDEIKAVLAYLQSLGGEATITLDTAVPYAETKAGA